MNAGGWGGRRATRARAIVAGWLPMPCGKCGNTVTAEHKWVVGHKKDRWKYPELTWEPTNWAAEHATCSDRSGVQARIDKAVSERLSEHSVSPGEGYQQTAPLLPFSPSEHSDRPSRPVEIPETLRWPLSALSWPLWLQPYHEVPDNAAPPLAMTPPHPRATGSYGPEAIEWIEQVEGKELRWWQKLAIVMQLQHDKDGRLPVRKVVESCSRRVGKSVRVRGIALWRMENAEMFGERQEIVHTGSGMAVCRRIQKEAWPWCEAQGWNVRRANGFESVETGDGHAWLVRAQDNVYGNDTTLGIVDEGWNVQPIAVDDGLEPSLMERQSSQLHMTSTAHRRATSLMRKAIADALTQEDPDTLLLLWAAPPDADPGDPDVWKAASPHWSEDRRRQIESAYRKALAGEAEPEFDDPDPMAGFVSQYLNIWQLKERRAPKGEQVASAEVWDDLADTTPDRPADAVAIEDWFGKGVTAAYAWRTGSGNVHVTASDHPDLASAVAAAKESGYRGRVVVGKRFIDESHPALRGLRCRSGAGRSGAAVQDLQRLLREDRLTHDSEHLREQVLAIRTVPGADGPRITSTGRADAVKAAVWAVAAAQARTGKPRIVTASS